MSDERTLASEARHGGRVITSNLADYLLPEGNPSAEIARAALASPDADSRRTFFRTHIEPAFGLEEWAAYRAKGLDATRAELLDEAIHWPVIRIALGLPL